MAKSISIQGTSSTAKIRHPLAVFGLVFLTLGVYYLVWYYKINRELRDLGRATGTEERLGSSPLTSLLAITLGWLIIVPPFVSFYRTFERIEAAQELRRTDTRVNVYLGFALYLLGLFTLPAELVYAQSELNRVWRLESVLSAPTVSVAA
jgi:Ca2+/Na+ antiporter